MKKYLPKLGWFKAIVLLILWISICNEHKLSDALFRFSKNLKTVQETVIPNETDAFVEKLAFLSACNFLLISFVLFLQILSIFKKNK